MNLGCDPVIYYRDTQETDIVLQMFFFQRCKNVSCVNVGLVTLQCFFICLLSNVKNKNNKASNINIFLVEIVSILMISNM